MPKILGVSASLRNARFGQGSQQLLQELKSLATKEALIGYINSQVKVRAEDCFAAGRRDNQSFDEIYKSLEKLKGDRGLSNSEAALSVALWAAYQERVEIDHLPLASHFSPTGKIFKVASLKEKVLSADAILLASPVYFGDRGSLSQSFIEFLHSDAELKHHVKNKVYAGVAVGAKRNGGQETTLIYQIVDMANLNMLAVGNDSETTSQYGGTAVAGDVGTFSEDEYGIKTCIGTGRRLAEVTKIMSAKSKPVEGHKITIDLWLLQDNKEKHGFKFYSQWVDDISSQVDQVNFRLRDFTDAYIGRCIACDLCPIDTGPKEKYRCIVTKSNDLFKQQHQSFLQTHGILLCGYSPKDRTEIKSVYQKFIERTRYFRRDDYVFSNLLIAPFVVSEVSANQNLHLRMLTSGIRHHTVLHHPLIGVEYNKKILNYEELLVQGKSFLNLAKRLVVNSAAVQPAATPYNPIGYVISYEKIKQNEKRLENA